MRFTDRERRKPRSISRMSRRKQTRILADIATQSAINDLRRDAEELQRGEVK
jgi:hypothetical protein